MPAPSNRGIGQGKNENLVMVMILLVIMTIPIMVGVPVFGVFIPPAVVVSPAIRPSLRQFLPPVFGLWTLRTVLVNGLVEIMIGPDGAFLTVVLRAHNGGPCEH
jgi:hypothetical protein